MDLTVTYIAEAVMDAYISPLLEQITSSAFFQEAEAKKRRKNKKKKKRKNGNGNNSPGNNNPPGNNTPPGPPPDPPPPGDLRVRRSIFSLSAGEVQNLTSALNAVKNAGAYDEFVGRHFEAMDVAHRGPLFLPWHRKFLEELESALLGVNPSIGALPYWPWEQGSGSLWTDAYFGPDGEPPDSLVPSGPFVNWTALVFNAGSGQLEPRNFVGLVRDLGSPGSLPSAATVQNILDDAAAYGDVRPGLENAPLHNSIHLWVGGDMRVGTSPNDPIFFLHHCNVDRLWWQWQLSNGLDNYQGPTGPMPLVQGSTTPAQVFDIHARGYTYQ